MPKKVLIIENDNVFLNELIDFLEKNNYEIIHSDINEAFQRLEKEKPDIILLDIYGIEKEALEFCRKVKEDRFYFLIPIIVYSKIDNSDQKADFLTQGADEFLVKPFELKELEIRIQSIIKRLRETSSSSPLTGLPGNVSISEEIKKRIIESKKFAVCYADLDNFKAYNDRYGYEKGDEVIKFLAETINDILKKYDDKNDFLGHIGGDDFIIITTPSKMEEVSNQIIEKFESGIINFYNEEDKAKGYITVKNRRGQVQLFPIMSISIGIAHNIKRKLYNVVQVAEIAAELKEYAKTKKGSNIAIDRRAE